jgi:RNA polymerase sigma-70 factor (ECF subfamily)
VPDCAELFQQARGGDRTAFDGLRGALEPRLRRFIVRLIGPSPDEEDILQDAFLALYLNLGRIEPAENLLPFLFRVVRNRCYDELRRKGRFQWVSLDLPPDLGGAAIRDLRDRSPPPDAVVQWLLVRSEVQRALDRLPELQRQAMILLCEEELSYAQIATAMGTDLGTVKSRIHYARQSLRRKLRPEILESLGIE